MGTGSFGGGSGSLGGGGGGAGGGGGGRGSLLRAIESLRDITRKLAADGDQPRLTRELYTLLRDRGRANFIKDLLGDSFTNALLQDLLAVKEQLDAGRTWGQIAKAYGVSDKAGTLVNFCDARIEQALAERNHAVDERYINCAGAALRVFMQRSVGGNLVLATTGTAAAVQAAIVRDMFRNTIGNYLGALIAQAIKTDCVHELRAAWPSVETACNSIAVACYDRFERAYVGKGKAAPRDALAVLSEHYSPLMVGS